jgi:hypothetical protein
MQDLKKQFGKTVAAFLEIAAAVLSLFRNSKRSRYNVQLL